MVSRFINVIKSPNGVTKLRSNGYNYDFNRNTGMFIRWGKTVDDDPQQAPFPEIADIEISTICHGINNTPCPWCYKSNTSKGSYMSFHVFQNILNSMPWLTQIAFGIGDIDSNPDLWAIMKLCRLRDIVPNITINGARMEAYHYDKLAEFCGAVAVSRYQDKDVCYNAVKELTDRGMEQVNIHMLVANETKEMCYETLLDMQNDSRLSKLNAVVFLSLKKKGSRNVFTKLSDEEFGELVLDALDNELPIGFDSCSCHKFIRAIRESGIKKYESLEQMSEPCESTLFSVYINVEGKMYPCSFMEEGEGINCVNCTDFIKEVWNHSKTQEFRKELLDNERRCLKYEI